MKLPASEDPLLTRITRCQTHALIIAAVASIASLILAISNRTQFLHSYLFAWLFWSGISFGALVVAMMQFLTAGQWGMALRGLATAAFSMIPLMGILFLPVLFGLGDIYGWTHGAVKGTSLGFHHQAQWLNEPFFIARSILYLVILGMIALLLRRWSSTDSDRVRMAPKIRALSAGGLILYVLCMNFASVDWVMSLDPQWYSTIFVIILAAGHFLGALALLTAILTWFARDPQLGVVISGKIYNDLGNMLLAFVIFWIYVSFSQFLIIWSGNLPKEISWYLQRSRGGWQWFAILLVIAQFLIPFALLLSRAAKRNRERLGAVSWAIFSASILNTFWLVMPSLHPGGFSIHWLDGSVFIALGGIWMALFFKRLRTHPLFPEELVRGTRS